MRAPQHEPSQHPRAVVRDPRPRQESAASSCGEDPGVDLVGLDLRLRDRPRLARVRTTTRRTSGRRSSRSRPSSSSPHRDLILGPSPAAHARSSSGRTSSGPRRGTGRPRRSRSARTTMHFHTDPSHSPVPSSTGWTRNPSGGSDRNGFALAAQSGQSQGRPSTNRARSSTCRRPAQPIPPRRPEPGPSHPTHDPEPLNGCRAGRRRMATTAYIRDTNAIEALNRQLRKAVKTKAAPPPRTPPGTHLPRDPNAAPQWTRTGTGRRHCSRSRSTSETAARQRRMTPSRRPTPSSR